MKIDLRIRRIRLHFPLGLFAFVFGVDGRVFVRSGDGAGGVHLIYPLYPYSHVHAQGIVIEGGTVG